MRLFFIPGFGEDETIFDKIKPFIPGEKVMLNNWTLLGNEPRKDLDALQYAKQLIERFQIMKEDVIIGHSLGGWVAFHIKHIIDCRIIQIASWTDDKKVVKLVSNARFMYWLIQRGWYFNNVAKNIIARLQYRNKPSLELFLTIFERLKRGNKENVINQLRVVFNPVNETIIAMPDLRIHSKNDNVILYPDQPFHEVPGDHFTLYTHPEAVYKPIVNFLRG
ncbi:MAG: hypothetical protein JWQ40_2538 [Segetibacter sp.]|nr:hypothetical protein [Segetibacter sp.]